MNALEALWTLWCEIYYGAALRQLTARDPMHDDIPELVKINNAIARRLEGKS